MFEPRRAKFGGDLELASGIRQHDIIRACRNNIVGFAPRQVARHCGFGQIVRSSRAAAEIGIRHLDDRHAWNRCEQFARRFTHSESMREVTSVVISDAASKFALRTGRCVEQQRTQVPHFRGNRARRPANFGSSLSRSPYSAIATERPDAADTIASAPEFFSARTFARAKSQAGVPLPECRSSAPQHEVGSIWTTR